jgi:hypothetical protein
MPLAKLAQVSVSLAAVRAGSADDQLAVLAHELSVAPRLVMLDAQ